MSDLVGNPEVFLFSGVAAHLFKLDQVRANEKFVELKISQIPCSIKCNNGKTFGKY